MRTPLLPIFVLPLVLASPAAAGICWSGMERGGRCSSVLELQVSRAECCAGGRPAAWSPKDLSDVQIFLYRSVERGVPCTSCMESCSGMRCGAGRRCVVRGGEARCVCSTHCRRAPLPHGPVCGTDGNTYRALCRLRQRACRKPSRHLSLNYVGRCQVGSCNGIQCNEGKRCVLDSELGTHCVRCSTCTVAGSPVCAVDGRTYAGECALRRAACERGRSLPLAYRGSCKVNATCSTIRCPSNQLCISGGASGARCVSCASKCVGGSRALCGTDSVTYASWCRLQRAVCLSGVLVEVAHVGNCTGKSDVTTNRVIGVKRVYKVGTADLFV